ncbi:MAG: hypothetical protein LBU60_01700 [Clostridiales bacterium]|nr:hypothetical protein [Clostridiales bacterium]
MSGGLVGAIVGGVVGGAIMGAVISIATQGVQNGLTTSTGSSGYGCFDWCNY